MAEDIAQWLEELNLGQYAQAFSENQIDFDILSDLTEADLEKLGIPLGDQKRLLRAIAARLEPSEKPAEQSPVDPSPTSSPEAERRQLTVMFCDMVGSTALSTRLDPEDYREIIRAYQDACAGMITRYDGYVAKFMGDGVLAYFGWPRGHENDAERAISAGLGVVEAVGDIAPADGETEPLAVRIGVATGPVVVGDIVGEGSAQEAAVTGETPNLAARLQEIAEPNSVAIAATTHALAGGLFSYEAMGGQSLKGIDGSTDVWRVVGERQVESRFTATHTTALTPLIGREEELELLSRRWERAKGGEGQVVLLTGEPGIGKSRLTQALQDWIGDEPHTRLLYQCSPHHTSSALYPIMNHLEIAARFEPADDPNARLDKLAVLLAQAGQLTDQIMPLFAGLLSVPADERYPLPKMTSQEQKSRTLAALVEQLVGLSVLKPVLFVFEDAHWIDPTSLELLELVVTAAANFSALVIVTGRPEFSAPWIGSAHVTALILNRLTADACVAMAEGLSAGAELPMEVLEQIIARTDGVPLFVEELTRAVLDAEKQTGLAGDVAVPASLQDALEARFDRIPSMREVAQIGAAIGRTFSHTVLSAVASLEPMAIAAALDKLGDAGIITMRGSPPDATYSFKHALVQNVAYESLLRGRRQSLHAAIADALEGHANGKGNVESETLAHHYTEAGDLDAAIENWQRAGKRSTDQFANAEAVTQFRRAIELLLEMPEGRERDERELDLQVDLLAPLTAYAGQGSREVDELSMRALELCERLDEAAKSLPVLHSRYAYFQGSGRPVLALENAEELLRRAEVLGDELHQMVGHRVTAGALWHIGKLASALKHSDQTVELYESGLNDVLPAGLGLDIKTTGIAVRTATLWLMGFPERAAASLEEGIAHARTLNHPDSLGFILTHAGVFLHSIAREPERGVPYVEELLALDEEFGMPTFAGMSKFYIAHAKYADGNVTDGISMMRDILGTPENPADPVFWPANAALLAEALSACGDSELALSYLDKAQEITDATEERWSEPELRRVRGDILRNSGEEIDVEASYWRAIEIARGHEARTFELRSAAALARLWQSQGKFTEARDLLSPVYVWFTEGFDTPDFQEAKALLDELL